MAQTMKMALTILVTHSGTRFMQIVSQKPREGSTCGRDSRAMVGKINEVKGEP